MARAACVSFKMAETEQGASPTRAATVFRFTPFSSGNVFPLHVMSDARLSPEWFTDWWRRFFLERLGSMKLSGSLRGEESDGELEVPLLRGRTDTDTLLQMGSLSPTQKIHRKDSG